MNEVFIGRQPIYDPALNVEGYELLFRSGDDNRADFVDGDQATGQVLLNALVEIGLDSLVGDRLAFMNLTRRFLTDVETLPLDPSRVVLEVLEDIDPDDEVVASLDRLSHQGYRLALDDFQPSERHQRMLRHVEIVKLDLRALSREQVEHQVRGLRAAGVKRILAEKVETLDEFEWCKKIGCDLFQGYFLSRPRVVRTQTIPNNRLASLQLLSKLQNPAVEVAELEKLIATDVALSFKLLQYVNSASIGLRRKVESIRQAIALLGLKRLQSMVVLIVMSGISNKPAALMTTAIVRAKMCEQLARQMNRLDVESFYITGLFSTLDALLDTPMDVILKSLPLSDDVREALLNQEGAMGQALRCVLAVEHVTWEDVQCLDLTMGDIVKAHLAAIAAAEECQSALGSVATPETRPAAKPALSRC